MAPAPPLWSHRLQSKPPGLVPAGDRAEQDGCVLCSATQACPTLCDPTDGSLPDIPVRGVLQARILQVVATPSSRGSSRPRDQVRVFRTEAEGFILWAIREAQDAVAAAAAKSLQSCPTLCDPIDGSPPGSPVPEILQARTLEWVAISFSNAWKWKVKEKSLSRVRLFTTQWTAAYQAPRSMGFSRQEYWSGVPLLSLRRGWRRSKTRHGRHESPLISKFDTRTRPTFQTFLTTILQFKGVNPTIFASFSPSLSVRYALLSSPLFSFSLKHIPLMSSMFNSVLVYSSWRL